MTNHEQTSEAMERKKYIVVVEVVVVAAAVAVVIIVVVVVLNVDVVVILDVVVVIVVDVVMIHSVDDCNGDSGHADKNGYSYNRDIGLVYSDLSYFPQLLTFSFLSFPL